MTLQKRVFDLTLLIVLLPVALPVMTLIACAALLIQGRPIFYISERMMTAQRGFHMIKFRSMPRQFNDAQATGGYKTQRLTRFGRFLRRTHLDELPQLWNILRGEMSFVGPRAPLRRYVDLRPDLYRDVLKCRPGATGLASVVYRQTEGQLLVNCRNAAENDRIYLRRCVPRKARLDLIYRAEQSLENDLRILLATFTRRIRPLAKKQAPAPKSLTPLPGYAHLLDRPPIAPQSAETVEAYRDQTILVTGAGGSIGAELCRQLMRGQPKTILLLEQSELALFQIQTELQPLVRATKLIPILGSVSDGALLKELFAQHQVDTIFHTAAFKHVPLLESNMRVALFNNVLGTKTLAEAARRSAVGRFILLSSDKAVRPKSVMGATKRLSEIIVQDLATRSEKTTFSIVRFGNVLGSSGSVVPLFEGQIHAGGPVTVTHPEITRYFMTIPEAVDLVLISGQGAANGDINILSMGQPVLIKTLAEKMIRSSNQNIEIKYIGLRPGEKLREELSITPNLTATAHPKIMCARESHPSEIEVANMLKELQRALDARSDLLAKHVIGRWVEQTSPQQGSGDVSISR